MHSSMAVLAALLRIFPASCDEWDLLYGHWVYMVAVETIQSNSRF